jgi:hypothetical protein
MRHGLLICARPIVTLPGESTQCRDHKGGEIARQNPGFASTLRHHAKPLRSHRSRRRNPSYILPFVMQEPVSARAIQQKGRKCQLGIRRKALFLPPWPWRLARGSHARRAMSSRHRARQLDGLPGRTRYDRRGRIQRARSGASPLSTHQHGQRSRPSRAITDSLCGQSEIKDGNTRNRMCARRPRGDRRDTDLVRARTGAALDRRRGARAAPLRPRDGRG